MTHFSSIILALFTFLIAAPSHAWTSAAVAEKGFYALYTADTKFDAERQVISTCKNMGRKECRLAVSVARGSVFIFTEGQQNYIGSSEQPRKAFEQAVSQCKTKSCKKTVSIWDEGTPWMTVAYSDKKIFAASSYEPESSIDAAMNKCMRASPISSPCKLAGKEPFAGNLYLATARAGKSFGVGFSRGTMSDAEKMALSKCEEDKFDSAEKASCLVIERAQNIEKTPVPPEMGEVLTEILLKESKG